MDYTNDYLSDVEEYVVEFIEEVMDELGAEEAKKDGLEHWTFIGILDVLVDKGYIWGNPITAQDDVLGDCVTYRNAREVLLRYNYLDFGGYTYDHILAAHMTKELIDKRSKNLVEKTGISLDGMLQ